MYVKQLHMAKYDDINHTCGNVFSGQASLPLNLGYEWVVPTHQISKCVNIHLCHCLKRMLFKNDGIPVPLYDIIVSYTLSRECRVVSNRYSRSSFTSEDRICANLSVQEQSTNMTSQCQYPTLAWCYIHVSTVVKSQCLVREDRPLRQWRNQPSIIVLSRIVCPGHKIASKK